MDLKGIEGIGLPAFLIIFALMLFGIWLLFKFFYNPKK
jgi:hypothetical protein